MFVLLVGLFVYPSHVQAMTQYRTQKSLKHEIIDVSLNWDISLLKEGLREFCLWDNWPLTQCYVSFKYGLDASLQVPATLSVSYPNIAEPGENFEVTTSLNLIGTRLLTITPEFFLKIHLMLPSPVYLPIIGWTRDFHNTFGGKWSLSFDINSRHLKDVIDQIFIGDSNTLESYANAINLPSFVTIERISYNTDTLGELLSGKIRVDFLKAILTAAEGLSIVNPVLQAALRVLRWLVQDVFNTSTGLLITPKLSARIESPTITDTRVQNLGVSSLKFESDMSSKAIPAPLSSTSEEGTLGNNFSIDLSPMMFRLLFDVDWDYYFDVDLHALGVSLYKNNWNFPLFTYPKLSWDSVTVKPKVPFSMKVDEPLAASNPQSEVGTVRIQLDDKSGIERAEMKYSTDKTSWQTVQMTHGSNIYSATPSVPEDTPIYYYISVADGDGDVYEINNDEAYFSYILPKPQLPMNEYLNRIPTPILVSIPIIASVVTVIIVATKKRSRVRNS